ncbi:hypothetical protein CHLRE_06g306450v5 [Chlamydomonas reinhardtii]|uniref:Phospholipase/carboxylesterase/thioesterase domain-containing protein n=1 Tax=Chlamydomonas reinhardtii TaxID=3055 RepID=A0A2K3DRI7_CHLRE|nr:uncharacterized protein CHLRE_06g306450v5 [Chlamydomonas reinhardtii]PNW83098.1 hypothetical protein CHLRE_06g306450v5 [Chlamydomonas reinhardtii]
MAGQLASRPLPTDAFLRGPPGTGAAPQQQPDTAQGRDTFPAGPSASAGAASSKGLSLTISPGKARPLGLSAAPAAGANVIRGGRSSGRDGFVYVPRSYHPGRPSPLAVMLHGAGGRADPQSGNWSFGGLQALEESACILLVPESRGSTWDVIRCGFGPDVAHIDAALGRVFASCAVDPGRVTLAGFSDGASYALSLGLGNPQLFTHLVAFSPGFMRPPPAAEAAMQRGGISGSSGTSDSGSSSGGSIDVTYHEFDGGHVIPRDVAAEGLAFFLGSRV